MKQHQTNRPSRLPVQAQDDVIGQLDASGRVLLGKEDPPNISILGLDHTPGGAITPFKSSLLTDYLIQTLPPLGGCIESLLSIPTLLANN